MTKKRGVPEGWLPVSAVGKPIGGTRFLAFKVPLKDTLCNNLQPDERFSPAMLLEKEPNLRLVIDLTNTMRYYDKNEFTQNGVNYEKIFCPGREIPGRDLMNRFFNVVDNFMQAEDTEDKFIGVHCTHGINRTGYFICTYMIQKLGFTPDKAISAFQEARGHEIVRDYFITELMKENSIKYDGNCDKLQETFNNSDNSNSPRRSPHKRSPHKHNPHRHNPPRHNPPRHNPPRHSPHKHSPHTSSSNWRHRSPPRQFDRRSRGGPPGPSRGPPEDHNNWRHRGKMPCHPGPHHPGPPRQGLLSTPREYFGQQSQLNYYEDDGSQYRRFHWRKDNSGGRRRHREFNSQNSDS